MTFHKPTYSLPALHKYLTHISLPPPHTTTLLQNLSSKQWSTSSSALSSLQTLQKYQQAKIPFANLYLHYSKYHLGTLDERALWEYIVDSGGIATEGQITTTLSDSDGKEEGILSQESTEIQRALEWKGKSARELKWEGRQASGGRGGTCTMNNGFFGTVMRTLGMSVKSTGARVALSVSGGRKGRFAGWNHLVNLVSFEGKKYLVDVGFGGNGPTAPVKLEDGNEISWGVTRDKIRVLWKGIDEYETPGEKCWVLQHKREKGQEWDDVYCFGENEFTQDDIGVMNWKTARDVRGSFFNHMVLCVKNILEGEDVAGTVIMTDGTVKRRIRGKNEVLRECTSEVDRWEALEEYFDIVLGKQERVGIKGMVTELRAPPEDDI